MTARLWPRRERWERWDYLPLTHCDRCDGPRPHGDNGRSCLGCRAREQATP